MKLACLTKCAVRTPIKGWRGWFYDGYCNKPVYAIWPTAVLAAMCKEHYENITKEMTVPPVLYDLGDAET